MLPYPTFGQTSGLFSTHFSDAENYHDYVVITTPDNVWVAPFSVSTPLLKYDFNGNLLSTSAPFDGSCYGLCFDGTYIWATGLNAGSITKILAATNTVIATYMAGLGLNTPLGCVADNLGRIWIANSGTNTLTVISAASGALVATVTVGNEPYNVTFDGTYVWSSNFADSTVSKVLASSQVVAGTFSVSPGAGPVYVLAVGTDIWACNLTSGNVTKLNGTTGAVIAIYATGSEPTSCCFDGVNLWIANQDSGNFTVLTESTGALVGTFGVGTTNSFCAYGGGYVWTALYETQCFLRVNANPIEPSGSYTSAQVKLRTLAQMNAALVADLSGAPPQSPFRWMNRQLQPGEVANKVSAGTCVTCTQAGNIRQGNQSGIGNLEWLRLTVTVYDLDSETARSVSNDVINFMETVDLCSNDQFASPPTSASQNPVTYLGQRDGMIPNPQSPSGPVYAVHTDFRVANRADLSIN
jgi:YVTN family beta-propeller protein